MNAYTLATILKDEHTLLAFDYGSVVYGTLTEFSDHDVVAVVDDEIDLSGYTNGLFEFHWDEHPLCPEHLRNQDWQFVNESRWIEIIKNHGILWLECYSLPKEHIIKGDPSVYMKYFTLDRWLLRKNVISPIASNAWAKTGKKMTVEKDFDLYRGQKSLFHSLRIMMFGIQIAKFGKITDYSEANYLWDEIYKMGNCGWDVYQAKYKELTNKLHSEFVALCPKPENYKIENQTTKQKFTQKKMEAININNVISQAMSDYKDVVAAAKENPALKEKADEQKFYLDVMRGVKQSFLAFVTDKKNAKKFSAEDDPGKRIEKIDPSDQLKLIETLISERKGDLERAEKAKREEHILQNTKEIAVLNTLLPKEATKEDVIAWLNENCPEGIEDAKIGKTIGAAKAAFERADGKMVSETVKEFAASKK